MSFRYFIDSLHRELKAQGWHDVRPVYGFVLLAARCGITAQNLAELMGMSKQAAAKIVHAMEASDYVVRAPRNDDARAKEIRLTARGEQLLAAVETIYRDIEGGWADVLGQDQLEQVRTALTTALRATNDGELPAVRPTW
ncbi:MarR family winged helix-turn-helix transcriptional regulator [Saccharospirillum mangrovi]|uniref:MarR family winged helix-turn-helix transcriptional regulator n=1 Tax=Saccharospirillum mangrovi TaxID=2161747 RepID=UPI00130035C3|nr:MarR family winged helix-turn-helix transcriptional regulator [Saccharospirillum mangrovi]